LSNEQKLARQPPPLVITWGQLKRGKNDALLKPQES